MWYVIAPRGTVLGENMTLENAKVCAQTNRIVYQLVYLVLIIEGRVRDVMEF